MELAVQRIRLLPPDLGVSRSHVVDGKKEYRNYLALGVLVLAPDRWPKVRCAGQSCTGSDTVTRWQLRIWVATMGRLLNHSERLTRLPIGVEQLYCLGSDVVLMLCTVEETIGYDPASVDEVARDPQRSDQQATAFASLA